ncbi:LuxR C-terminal-related transcriptional regulator [Nocardioides yefusunii]|uniref:LuxR C-terminal-related transcriptional regulator n=1 Tax=Nocardioides yefusunii TaxID=2500546 RepID=A0ABW1QZE7_9ACTN|nr:LuxR C-terminal-related transcriptional regulator [Nocardioides yefusunii]
MDVGGHSTENTQTVAPPTSGGMAVPWSALRAPEPGNWFVPRGRLDELLDAAAVRHEVIEVVAPGGFGKTTALAHWAAHRSAPTAWVSVNSHTRNPQRLASGISRSLADAVRGRPGFEQLAGSVGDVGTAAGAVTRWIEALERAPERVVLIVDDVHHAPGILDHGPLALLLDAAPRNLCVVVTSHTPDPSLVRRRVAGMIGLVTSDELRMTRDEVLSVSRALDRELDADVIESIHTGTGGWPVAVGLELLAPGVVLPMAGEPMRDYIQHEILAKLPADLVTLVLSTSLLERFDTEAARQVSGLPETQALLGELLDRGLFLTRVSDRTGRVSYRWHARVARECRELFRASRPSDFVQGARAAVQVLWHDDPVAALDVACCADQVDLVRALLGDHWLSLLVEGDLAVLRDSIAALDPDQRGETVVLVLEAALAQLGGDHELAAMLVDSARAAAVPGVARDRLALAQMSLMGANEGNELERACDEVRDLLRTDVVPGRPEHAVTVFLLGWAELRLRRAPLRALDLLRTSARLASEAHASVLERRARANAGFAAAFLGDFEAAEEELRTLGGRKVAGADIWEVYDGGLTDFTEGWIGFWRGDLTIAEQKFGAVIADHGRVAYAPLARVLQVWVACSIGDPRRIRRADQARRDIPDADAHGVPWAHYALVARAKILVAQGAGASQVVPLLRQAADRANVPVIALESAVMLHRMGQLGDTVDALRRLSPLERQPLYVQTGALVVNALVQRRRGETESAHRLLERALDLGAPARLGRAFDLTQPGLRPLLAAHAARGTAHPEYVAHCLAGNTSVDASSPVGGLSSREREILEYMRGTLTNAEIAAALHVSVNTVKTHQRSIYRKFNVATRREAVRLADAT